MTRNWKRNVAAAALGISASLSALPAQRCVAMGHTHGPVYRTLDALAGGIEMVIDVASSMGRKSATSCDELSCDDACDAATISQLESTSDHGYLEMQSPESHQHSIPQTDAIPMPPPLQMPNLAPMSDPQPSFKPNSAPRTSGPMPQPVPMSETPKKEVEDEWLNSFSPKPMPSQGGKRTTPTKKRPETRGPAETYDSLPDPFLDDPQTRKQAQPANQPASYWEAW